MPASLSTRLCSWHRSSAWNGPCRTTWQDSRIAFIVDLRAKLGRLMRLYSRKKLGACARSCVPIHTTSRYSWMHHEGNCDMHCDNYGMYLHRWCWRHATWLRGNNTMPKRILDLAVKSFSCDDAEVALSHFSIMFIRRTRRHFVYLLLFATSALALPLAQVALLIVLSSLYQGAHKGWFDIGSQVGADLDPAKVASLDASFAIHVTADYQIARLRERCGAMFSDTFLISLFVVVILILHFCTCRVGLICGAGIGALHRYRETHSIFDQSLIHVGVKPFLLALLALVSASFSLYLWYFGAYWYTYALLFFACTLCAGICFWCTWVFIEQRRLGRSLGEEPYCWCRRCGYSLVGIGASTKCPECAQSYRNHLARSEWGCRARILSLGWLSLLVLGVLATPLPLLRPRVPRTVPTNEKLTYSSESRPTSVLRVGSGRGVFLRDRANHIIGIIAIPAPRLGPYKTTDDAVLLWGEVENDEGAPQHSRRVWYACRQSLDAGMAFVWIGYSAWVLMPDQNSTGSRVASRAYSYKSLGVHSISNLPAENCIDIDMIDAAIASSIKAWPGSTNSLLHRIESSVIKFVEAP